MPAVILAGKVPVKGTVKYPRFEGAKISAHVFLTNRVIFQVILNIIAIDQSAFLAPNIAPL